jgi:hypothetical protein
MWRTLITAGLVLALSGPAFADQTASMVKKRTVKKSMVVHHRVHRRVTHQSTVVQLPPPPAPVRAATVRPTSGHWSWVPSMQSYTWVADTGTAPAPLFAWSLFR